MTLTIQDLSKQAVNAIDPAQYARHRVHRGLRDPDTNAGVLVGLTTIAQVIGNVEVDTERMPVDGVLTYRGVDVGSIAREVQEHPGYAFERVLHLLLFGSLPDVSRTRAFVALLCRLRADVAFKSKNPMVGMTRGILELHRHAQRPDSISVADALSHALTIIANAPEILAQAVGRGPASIPLAAEMSAAKRLLSLLTSEDIAAIPPQHIEVMDLLLALHAEHGGGNNSTFAVRVVTSAGTDTFSAIAAGMCSLKGPLHGGAANMARAMMQDAKRRIPSGSWSDEQAIARYINDIFDGKAFDNAGLLYGFGHAVYTKSDPRAVILEGIAEKLSSGTPFEEEFSLYQVMARVAPKLFNQRKSKIIAPNVDYYSGFIYSVLGIGEDLYTPLFAVARMAGWAAHHLEEIQNGKRIMRPAYAYVGAKHPSCRLVPGNGGGSWQSAANGARDDTTIKG